MNKRNKDYITKRKAERKAFWADFYERVRIRAEFTQGLITTYEKLQNRTILENDPTVNIVS